MKDNGQICILCRGNSMALAETYFHNLADEMIIVNEFNEELKKSFVDQLFKNKNITHMVGADAGLSNLREEYYQKYNINKAVLNRFEDQASAISRMSALLKSFNVDTTYLPDSIREFQKEGGGFPTTGVISLVYSTVVLKKKDIHTAGMDFYEKDYFINIKANQHQKKKGLVMKSFVENFMKKFVNVKYTFYTSSSFKSSLDNVIIVNS